VNGVGDSWADMWGVVAERFEGREEVLGYELLNEPFMGDFYRDPLIAVPYPNPHNADAKRLQPAYDRLHASIRQNDNETLVFFAGVTWDDAGPGFTAPPGGEEYADRSVLAFHYYEPPQMSTTAQMDAQMRGAVRLNTGIFLTETWGGSNNIFGDDKIVYEAADDSLISWSYWEYKDFCRESDLTLASDSQQGVWGSCHGFGDNPNPHERRDRTRTYAEAVAGVTKSMHFDANDHSFALEYELDEAISMPTEIRISKDNYPSGFDVEIGGGGGGGLEWIYDEANDPYVLYVQKKKGLGLGEGRDNRDVKVTVTAIN